jgi:hypothetical protein
MPGDVAEDVLAVLSETEALAVAQVCERLAHVDAQTVSRALEDLRRDGRAVRWYAGDRSAVYRRVA